MPTKDDQVSIRLEPDVKQRAEALTEAMAVLPEFRAFRISRATVLRMAMVEGLAVLEQRHGASKSKLSPRKR